MKQLFSLVVLSLLWLVPAVASALTLNGDERERELTVCFDETAIGNKIGFGSTLQKNKEWVKKALQNSWEHHTFLKFSGWGDCASTVDPDIRISQHADGDVVSSGDTIFLPFFNVGNPDYQRFHVQSAAVHEMGHQLGFIHEHDRPDSNWYVQGISQRFRIVPEGSAGWFTIRPDITYNVKENQPNGLCLTDSITKVTQEFCSGLDSQKFRFKDGGIGDWTRIEFYTGNNGCLEIQAASLDLGAKLVRWGCHNGSNQLFKVTGKTYSNFSPVQYSIQVQHSLMMVEVPNHQWGPGIQPIQYRPYDQNFEYLTSYDNTSVMHYDNLRGTGFILSDLDVAGARDVYGSSYSTNPNYPTIPDYSDYIISRESKKCFTYGAQGFSQNTCSISDTSQQFRVVFLNDDEFRIYNESEDKCLEVASGDLILTQCASPSPQDINDNQRFTMTNEIDDWIQIESVGASGQCLDVYGGGDANGTEIGLWPCHSGLNQEFSVQEVFPYAPGKICDIDVPYSGTTSGCSSVPYAGTGTSNGYVVAYRAEKDGVYLMDVYKEYNTTLGTCDIINGSSQFSEVTLAYFEVVGSCSSYSINRR